MDSTEYSSRKDKTKLTEYKAAVYKITGLSDSKALKKQLKLLGVSLDLRKKYSWKLLAEGIANQINARIAKEKQDDVAHRVEYYRAWLGAFDSVNDPESLNLLKVLFLEISDVLHLWQ